MNSNRIQFDTGATRDAPSASPDNSPLRQTDLLRFSLQGESQPAYPGKEVVFADTRLTGPASPYRRIHAIRKPLDRRPQAPTPRHRD